MAARRLAREIWVVSQIGGALCGTIGGIAGGTAYGFNKMDSVAEKLTPGTMVVAVTLTAVSAVGGGTAGFIMGMAWPITFPALGYVYSTLKKRR